MDIVRVDKPYWDGGLAKLQLLEALTMAHNPVMVLNNWDLKYINIRVDMRTGSFMITDRNGKYLKLEPTQEG